MRKAYCCKKHVTRIWHTKWSKSLMNEGVEVDLSILFLKIFGETMERGSEGSDEI